MPSPILFLADSHIGMRQYGLQEREDDFRAAYNRFVDNALFLRKNRGLVATVLLGDINDTAHENRVNLQTILHGVHKMVSAGLTVWYLAGNHDYERPTLPECVLIPGFLDAQSEFEKCLAEGRAFQPYGEDGPKVAAFHYNHTNKLWEHMLEVRQREKPENASTHLWCHASIAQVAGNVPKAIDAVGFVNLGWHTIIAGDTHTGGCFPVKGEHQQGLVISPASPEMTEISESEEFVRGFILHTPADEERSVAPRERFARVRHHHRPYKTFNFVGTKTDEQVREVLEWITEVTAQSGLKPIVHIEGTDSAWQYCAEFRDHVLRQTFAYKSPKIIRPLVETAPAVLNEDGTVGGGNAAKYGDVHGPGTLWQKLTVVLDMSNLSPAAKELGSKILTHPFTPTQWSTESKDASTIMTAQAS